MSKDISFRNFATEENEEVERQIVAYYFLYNIGEKAYFYVERKDEEGKLTKQERRTLGAT